MRIAVSLLNLRPGQVGGAETYVRELLAHIPASLGGDTLVLVGDAEVRRSFGDSFRDAKVEWIVTDKSPRGIIIARVMEAFTPLHSRFAERAIDDARVDVVLFPQQSLFPKRVATPCVMTVGDIQHVFLPQNIGRFDRAFRAAIYDYSLRHADRLIAISQWTRQTLIDRYGLDPAKIAVVPHGVRARVNDDTSLSSLVSGPYLFYPATTQPHKNHATLLRTYAALRKAGRTPCRLVFSGKQTPLWNELQSLIRSLGIADDVVHVGYVPTSEVGRLYRGCDTVVFPTAFEGFGLPVTEAAAFGKRVVVSRLEVFDEIGVPRENQIDFSNADELAKALTLPTPTILQNAPWTWEQTAAATLGVLRDAAGKTPRS